MPELNIYLKPSRQFIVFILALIIMSWVTVSFLPVAIGFKILLNFIVTIYGGIILWRDGFLFHKKSIIGLSIHVGEWRLHQRDKIFPAKLQGDSTVTNWMSVFRFSTDEGQRSCLIWSDALSRDQYRKLRVKAFYR